MHREPFPKSRTETNSSGTLERKAGRGDAPGGRGKDQGAVHGGVRAPHGTEPRGGGEESGGLAGKFVLEPGCPRAA